MTFVLLMLVLTYYRYATNNFVMFAYWSFVAETRTPTAEDEEECKFVLPIYLRDTTLGSMTCFCICLSKKKKMAYSYRKRFASAGIKVFQIFKFEQLIPFRNRQKAININFFSTESFGP